MPETTERRAFSFLTNGLAIRLVSPVEIIPLLSTDQQTNANPVKLNALWDTGAEVTCISPAVRDKLKLSPADAIGNSTISGVGGDVPADITFVTIRILHDMELEYCPVYIVDFKDNDFDLIIGMDIITRGDFVVCNADNNTSFSFAMPPFPDRIDLTDKSRNRQ
jgi:hypothetical protein